MAVGEVAALGWEQSFHHSCKALTSLPQALLPAANASSVCSHPALTPSTK